MPLPNHSPYLGDGIPLKLSRAKYGVVMGWAGKFAMKQEGLARGKGLSKTWYLQITKDVHGTIRSSKTLSNMLPRRRHNSSLKRAPPSVDRRGKRGPCERWDCQEQVGEMASISLPSIVLNPQSPSSRQEGRDVNKFITTVLQVYGRPPNSSPCFCHSRLSRKAARRRRAYY